MIENDQKRIDPFHARARMCSWPCVLLPFGHTLQRLRQSVSSAGNQSAAPCHTRQRQEHALQPWLHGSRSTTEERHTKQQSDRMMESPREALHPTQKALPPLLNCVLALQKLACSCHALVCAPSHDR